MPNVRKGGDRSAKSEDEVMLFYGPETEFQTFHRAECGWAPGKLVPWKAIPRSLIEPKLKSLAAVEEAMGDLDSL